MRTEAQKRADDKYREKNKANVTTWGTQLKKDEAASIDALIKSHGMNRAQFLRWATNKLAGGNE